MITILQHHVFIFSDVNVLDIINTENLVMSLDAIQFIENRLCEDNRIITDPYYQFLSDRPTNQSDLNQIRRERAAELETVDEKQAVAY